MVLVYLLLFLVLAWTSGVHRLWFLLAGGLGSGGLALLYFLLWDKLKNVYFIRRVVVILDHLTGNPDTLTEQTQGIGWQQSRSLLAIGSGQLTGQGFLKGNLTQSPYETSLPARHTDEIFAVCGEEFGLLGCVLLLSLLTAIILRCFWVARRSRSYLSAYIATGFAAMLLIQTVINIAMCLYVFPVVGLTLPFFSYGGSSTLTLYIAMGIISGIRMRFLPSWLRDRSNL
jgi:rod shape determining protein RodA